MAIQDRTYGGGVEQGQENLGQCLTGEIGGGRFAEESESSQSKLAAKARDLRTLAEQQVAAAAERAKEMANQRMQATWQTACSEAEHAAEALRAAAQKLREQDDARLAGYTETLAGWADQCSGYLREHQFTDLAHQARSMVRARPEWVLGGLFVAGLALGRFLKASPRPDYNNSQDWDPETEPANWDAHAPASPGEARREGKDISYDQPQGQASGGMTGI